MAKTQSKYSEYKVKIETLGAHGQYGPTGQGWGIEQNPLELAAFLVKLHDIGIRTGDASKILEVGIVTGGLYRLMRNIMKWDVYIVDNKDAEPYIIKDHHYRGEVTVDAAVKWAKRKGPFGLVFIDIDRPYEVVKNTYDLYSPLATRLVAIHGVCGLHGYAGTKQLHDELDAEAAKPGSKLVVGRAIAQTDKKSGIGWVIK